MKNKKKEEGIQPDGKFIEDDAVEAHPDFHDEYVDMVDEVFAENPGYTALLKRIKNGSDQSSDK